MEILIPWDMIEKKYKHARMDENRNIYAYTHGVNASICVGAWVTGGDYTEITGLVTGYILGLDWKTFKATRPAEVKVETKKVYYTKEMHKNRKLPPIGCKCTFIGSNSNASGLKKGDEVEIFHHDIYCDSPTAMFKYKSKHDYAISFACAGSFAPLDTRTDEEKLIDDVADFLIDIDEDVLLHNNEAYVHDMAVKLISTSKFTITKKGD